MAVHRWPKTVCLVPHTTRCGRGRANSVSDIAAANSIVVLFAREQARAAKPIGAEIMRFTGSRRAVHHHNHRRVSRAASA